MKAMKRLFGRKSKTRQQQASSSTGSASIRRSEPLSHEEQPVDFGQTEPTERVFRYSSPPPHSPSAVGATDVVSADHFSNPIDNKDRQSSARNQPSPYSPEDGSTTKTQSNHRSHTVTATIQLRQQKPTTPPEIAVAIPPVVVQLTKQHEGQQGHLEQQLHCPCRSRATGSTTKSIQLLNLLLLSR